MKHNYVLKSADELLAVLKKMESVFPGRVFVTGVTTGGTVSAPTKRRAHYEHKLNHGFAPECFSSNGVAALLSGGGFYIAHIPKEAINPELLPKTEESAASTGKADEPMPCQCGCGASPCIES